MLRSMFAAAVLLTSAQALAAKPNTYQVTGPVIAVSDDTITVQKGKEKWEIAKDATTKSSGTPKVGDKVTVEYRMAATNIEVKGKSDAKAEKAEKAEGKSDAKAAKGDAATK